jgi:hypothetical protein
MPQTEWKSLREKFHVRPDYGKENVYRVWDSDDNYHDDTSPEAMDRRAKLLAASPELLKALLAAGDYLLLTCHMSSEHQVMKKIYKALEAVRS